MCRPCAAAAVAAAEEQLFGSHEVVRDRKKSWEWIPRAREMRLRDDWEWRRVTKICAASRRGFASRIVWERFGERLDFVFSILSLNKVLGVR